MNPNFKTYTIIALQNIGLQRLEGEKIPGEKLRSHAKVTFYLQKSEISKQNGRRKTNYQVRLGVGGGQNG